jgi:hypothetical protein
VSDSGPNNDPTSPSPPPNGGLDVMSCEQAIRQIERLIEDSELKDIERALLFTHIRVCPACKAELQRRRQLELRLKETFAPLDTHADFNERLMAALPNMNYKPAPDAAPRTSEERSGARTSRLKNASGRVGAQLPRLRWLYRWRVPLGVAALVGIGLLGVLLRPGMTSLQRDADKPPIVLTLAGKAHVVSREGQSTNLIGERVLLPGDSLVADVPNTEFACWFDYGDAHLARVDLASGSELTADNRHVYTLRKGSAHFDVQKNRPHGPEELFEVNIANHGVVRVRGTVFDIKNAGTTSAVVEVHEGLVEVQCGTALTKLSVGQQVVLGPNGFGNTTVAVGIVPPAHDPRTNRNPLGSDPMVNPAVNPAAVNPTPPAPQVAVGRFDWDTRIGPLPLAGQTFAEGIDAVAARVGNPKVITDLAQLARGPLISQENRLSFSIHSLISVRSALAWMARDVSARFDVDADGRGQLRLANADELPGPVTNEDLPEYVRKAFDTPLEHAAGPGAGRMSLPVALDELGAVCGVTLIAEHSDATVPAADKSDPARQSSGRRLDTILGSTQLCATWYDGVLYLAPGARIEALTLVDRTSAPISELVGLPQQEQWSGNLLELVNGHVALPARIPRSLAGMPPSPDLPAYSNVDRALVGRRAFQNLSLADGDNGPYLRYRAGMLGNAWMSALLKELARGTQQVRGASGLTQLLPSGSIKDINALIDIAKPFMPVESRLKNPPFNHQALAIKNLSLGRALEWGAWLQGCGIRQGVGGLVIDDSAVCYGAPALQVVPLSPTADHPLDMANQLPTAFARLLPQLYPTFFAGVEIKPLSGRIAFVGDRRQLQLAQELFKSFDQELNESTANAHGDKQLDLNTWLPAWRRNLEKNLAEPFKGDGSGAVSGTFAGLLRQSGIGTQLHHTVVVDLTAMQQHHSDPVQSLDVSQLSLGQFIDALAHAAQMKVVLEGEVIWLKPAR